MGDCEHPEEDRRYGTVEGQAFCRRCNELFEFEETEEQRIARQRLVYSRSAKFPS